MIRTIDLWQNLFHSCRGIWRAASSCQKQGEADKSHVLIRVNSQQSLDQFAVLVVDSFKFFLDPST